MLNRYARLTKDDFKNLTDCAVSHTPHFSVKVCAAPLLSTTRFGIVISKKVAVHASDRKKLARRIRHVIYAVPKNNTPQKVVVYAKKGATTLTFKALTTELTTLFQEIL